MATNLQPFSAPLHYGPGEFLTEHGFRMELPGTCELTMTHRRKVWEFPRDRFITYEPSDEANCRALGLGREVAITETTVVPRAVVEFRDGAYQITALPDYSAPVEVNGFILKRRGDANL